MAAARYLAAIRWLTGLSILLSSAMVSTCFADALPADGGPPALEFPHFPSRTHAFVWRNWNVVATGRIAHVLGTTPEKVAAVAASMGLPPEDASGIKMMRERGYLTIIRRNWHLLPYAQLLELLQMSPDELGYVLREDDFLYIKLGSHKPQCPPLKYAEPDAKQLERCAQIQALVTQHFGDAMKQPEDPRFSFLKLFENAPPAKGPEAPKRAPDEHPRFIYSYFALFGDPLLDPKLDPFPDGLLRQLAEMGVNGVWLHVVLRHLAPGGPDFPEWGEHHERRLENLSKLVQRAKRHGIGVYLYMNEPRAMPHAFFTGGREHLQGVAQREHATLCTSTEPVRNWLRGSLTHVFKKVPDLAGVFTITASENLTS